MHVTIEKVAWVEAKESLGKCFVQLFLLAAIWARQRPVQEAFVSVKNIFTVEILDERIDVSAGKEAREVLIEDDNDLGGVSRSARDSFDLADTPNQLVLEKPGHTDHTAAADRLDLRLSCCCSHTFEE